MQYTFTPECRSAGPLAELAVAGSPTMARTRRPVLVEPRVRSIETGAHIELPPPPVRVDLAPRGASTSVWASDGMVYDCDTGVSVARMGSADEESSPEEVHYWDAADMAAAEDWPAARREGVTTCTTAYEDLRTVAARIAATPYDWSWMDAIPEREAASSFMRYVPAPRLPERY